MHISEHRRIVDELQEALAAKDAEIERLQNVDDALVYIVDEGTFRVGDTPNVTDLLASKDAKIAELEEKVVELLRRTSIH